MAGLSMIKLLLTGFKIKQRKEEEKKQYNGKTPPKRKHYYTNEDQLHVLRTPKQDFF